MSDDPNDITDRSALEAQADAVRAKLATTLGRLDRKRHEIAHLADVPAQIEEHVVPLAAGAALVLVATGALLTWSVVRMATASSRRPHERVEALRRAWYHPENVGRKKNSFMGDILRKIAMGAATTVAVQLAKKAMASPELSARLAQLHLPPALDKLLQPKPRKRVSGERARARVAVEPIDIRDLTALTDIARTGDAG